MNAVGVIAWQELKDGFRNRWVAAATALLAGLALVLSLVGTAPAGGTDVDPLAVAVVSLSSLGNYLIPLIALMLTYDAVVGEQERGTLLLLLAHPVGRGHLLAGKLLGGGAILAIAIGVGFGLAGAAAAAGGTIPAASWGALGRLAGSGLLLGLAFLAVGLLVSTAVRQVATAAGVAVVVWLFLVVLYDMAALGALAAGAGEVLPRGVVSAFLVLNPADAFRLFNLAGVEGAGALSGLAGVQETLGVPRSTLLAVLAAWVVVPLAAAGWLLRRREA